MPTRARQRREAHRRAEAVLLDRLSPGQRADVAETHWFNVRDAWGFLWRVRAGTDSRYDDDFAGYRFMRPFYPNLVDQTGRGRTMHESTFQVPGPDIALSMVMYLGDPDRARLVHYGACESRPYGESPVAEPLVAFYAHYKEDLGHSTRIELPPMSAFLHERVLVEWLRHHTPAISTWSGIASNVADGVVNIGDFRGQIDLRDPNER